MMRRVLSLLPLATLLVVLVAVRAQEPAKAPPSETPALPVIKDSAAAQQEILARQYRELEQSLHRLAQRLKQSPRPEDRDRAAMLEQAIQEASKVGINARYDKLMNILRTSKADNLQEVKSAITESEQLTKDLTALIDLLTRDNRADQLKAEQKRIADLIKELNKIIRDEKTIRAQNDAGRMDDADLAKAQGRVTGDTEAIAKAIGGQDGKDGKDGKGSDAKGENKPGDGKGGENAGEGKDDSQDAKGNEKEGEGGKDGQPGQDGQAGDAKDGKPQEGQGQAGDAKGGDPKDGQGQAGDAKGGEPKDGDPSQPNNDPNKPNNQGQDNKDGQDQKADSKGQGQGQGDGKSSDSQDGQPGEAKDSQGGDSQGGQQGQPGQGKGDSGQQGGDSGQQPPQPGGPQQPELPGKKQIQDAIEGQKKAEDNIKKGERDKAGKDLDQVIKNLEDARKKLEEILKQLREEETERLLANLKARCEQMLNMQIEVYKETVKVHKDILGNPDQKPTRANEVKSLQLADREGEIVIIATSAIQLLEAEGTAVAFPEVFIQVREDMRAVQNRLGKADVGVVTQAREELIIETLKEMIEALEKAQQDMQAQQQQPGDQGQQGQQQDQKLIDDLAELKMIRSMQIRVNNLTQTYAKNYEGEQAQQDDIVQELRELSERQGRIFEITRDIYLGRNR
ncbi:MAG: hypothetical protein ACK4RK_13660 [Gemmataceae bacterium]